MTYQLHTQDAPAIAEDPRVQSRRRIQQRRCLVCGARQLANQQISYFCVVHLATHRWCPICETLRTVEEHGRDSRCKGCATQKALAQYYADRDRTLYRLRLRQMARRQKTRADEIFEGVRRRIALADFVAATPGWTWEQRARSLGMDTHHIADSYRKQCSGCAYDSDRADREKRRGR